MSKTMLPIDLKQVEALSGIGLSQQQIADALGINYRTLWRRKKRFEEFKRILDHGKAKGISNVANALYEKAMIEKDTTAMIFFLKCRAGWQDRIALDIDHHVGGVSDDELRGLLMSAKQRQRELISGNGHSHLTEIPSNGEAVEFFEEAG